ncbi:subclass B3 metallo-beta-lactamase [Bradyrhizobium sp. LHD-71]|uniref:subclass B3 metallo-beta-lactamase n=1 Tax=Bradyrhizobium sp. LHD-71 TaxID=3072141 RepID=UPI00280F3F2F|nr:subclass B3 metallo-beta-lactamase [Bradyrhizobium sp. LHD-71]MDQ8731822.1 subclass B3 metallo-beta-lactamase [Bradyrhizobium sp. LHD-71]
MKILSAIALSLLLSASSVVSAGPVQAQTVSDLMAQMRAKWNTPTEPFRVIDNVYYVGTAGLSSFLVTSPDGHVLIDTGLPEATPLIKTNIDKLGFKLADIKVLLNTHAHLDHTGGLAELKKETGAQMVSSAADKPLLEGGYYPGRENDAELKFPPVKVDRIVGDGEKVTVGKLTLVAHMTPGHSPGCTTWTTVTREKRWNHTVVFFCSATVAANRLVGSNVTYPGIVEDYRKTFAKAKGIFADVFLAPHPEMFKMDEKRPQIGRSAFNPFIKAAEFHAFIRDAEKAFDEGLAKQKAAADAGE